MQNQNAHVYAEIIHLNSGLRLSVGILPGKNCRKRVRVELYEVDQGRVYIAVRLVVIYVLLVGFCSEDEHFNTCKHTHSETLNERPANVSIARAHDHRGIACNILFCRE